MISFLLLSFFICFRIYIKHSRELFQNTSNLFSTFSTMFGNQMLLLQHIFKFNLEFIRVLEILECPEVLFWHFQKIIDFWKSGKSTEILANVPSGNFWKIVAENQYEPCNYKFVIFSFLYSSLISI